MKPMLLSNDEFNLEDLDYTNMYISIKRDGVRAEITNEGIKNRSLKILRNKKVQDRFRSVFETLPDGMILEAEIYSESLPCRIIAGICNSDDKDVPEDLKLYVFGIYHPHLDFEDRYEMLKDLMMNKENDLWEMVVQTKINSKEDAMKLYSFYLDHGYEGAVLMDGWKKYKEGRVTINQHIGFKLKPHRTDDLEIIGVTERFLNTNESQTNELGRSFKRNTVDAKESTGIAATFICRMESGEETKVTITGEESVRREIWKNKETYIGRCAEVLSMDYGTKDKLRHPRLIKVKMKVEK